MVGVTVPHTLRVAVVGTRHATDAHYASFADRLTDALMQHSYALSVTPELDGVTHLVSGGARGIDTLAERFAASEHGQGVEMVVFPAAWSTHGRAAGPLRNIEIHDDADACVAFPDEGSRGTAHTISLFEASGKPLIVIPFESLGVSA